MKEPNLGVLLFGHDMEKIAAELVITAKEEKCKKVETLAKRLVNALSLCHKLLANPSDKIVQKEIMDKYGTQELIQKLQNEQN
jgi:hypothetical protein